MELDERREVAPESLLLGGDRQGHETHISQEEVPPVLPRRDGADRGRMAAFSGNPRAAAAMCARTAGTQVKPFGHVSKGLVDSAMDQALTPDNFFWTDCRAAMFADLRDVVYFPDPRTWRP